MTTDDIESYFGSIEKYGLPLPQSCVHSCCVMVIRRES